MGGLRGYLLDPDLDDDECLVVHPGSLAQAQTLPQAEQGKHDE